MFVIIALIIGIIIGLVIGWVVWPVTWTGGTLDVLSSAAQQDYLKAAIESYAYNPDAAVAQQRYTTLGDQKEKILSDILASPGNLKKTDIDAFVNAIKTVPVSITATEAVATSVPVTPQSETTVPSLLNVILNRPAWLNICLPVGMLAVVILIIVLVFLSRRNKKSGKTGDQSIETLEPGDAGMIEDISNQVSAGDVQPEAVQTFAEPRDEAVIPVYNELPDWLREASPENQPVPEEPKIEEPAVVLSDSDIKDITSSKFSTLESKPAPSPEPGQFEQGLTSSSAFLPDGSDKPVEPPIAPIQPEPQPETVVKAAPYHETQQETFAKFSREIELTPGINPEDAKKLRTLGITAPLLLLKKGASPQGRQSIAAGLGIPEMQVLKWVNSIDLLRIKGLTIEDAQVLKSIGVDILVELATRDPESLLEKLAASPQSITPSYKIPSLDQVQNWITQARELPRIISYS